MKTLSKLLVTGCAALYLTACAHTSEVDQQKQAFQKLAEKRVDAMEKIVAALEVRETQLLGQPKEELAQALAYLRKQTNVAKDQLDKLDDASKDRWVEVKSAVDKELFNMDTAYNSALSVFAKY
jgi:uncharacterized protein YPO0396